MFAENIEAGLIQLGALVVFIGICAIFEYMAFGD